jgi:hypothetical protein
MSISLGPIGKVKFQGFDCIVEIAAFADNGRPCIRLIDASDGEPIARASVNIPDEPIPEGESTHTFIKDYSGNDGILEVLQEAGYVGPIVREEVAGFELIQLVEILTK